MGRLLDWLRATTEEPPAPGSIVTISLGTELHRAHIIAAACQARGLRVELVTTELGGHPHTPGAVQQMLVRAEDIDEVREVLAAHDLG